MRKLEKYRVSGNPADLEFYYSCPCGFSEYLSASCNCDLCVQFSLPLMNCPKCNQEFPKENP